MRAHLRALRTLLFDLDGTLVDAKPGILASYAHTLAHLGYAPPEGDLAWCIGPPIRECFIRLLATDDAALVERACGVYREHYARTGQAESRVYDGVVEMLVALRARGYRLFLATAKSIPVATSVVEHFDLLRHLDGVYGAELDGTRADKADLVRYVLGREGCLPTATMLIGDRIHDVLGAHANGVLAGAVTYGYGSPEELAQAQPDYRFDSPRAIRDAFARLPAREEAR